MSCFNPNLVRTECSFGSVSTRFLGPAKGSFDPRDNPMHIESLLDDGYYYSLVPCGKCAGCRMDYSRNWANRMLVELRDNNNVGVFLTLTYNPEHLPYSDKGKPTLSKRDCQLFWKRLRKAFPGKKIRYYIAGEYGPKTHRPHYHAIVFGLSLSDFDDLEFLRFNGLGQSYYNSKRLANIWQNGYIVLSDVTWHTCAYVSRYVLKKRGKTNTYVFATGVEPEFNLSSRKPGIGLLHAADMIESGLTTFSFDGNDGVYQFSLNRAYYRSAETFLARQCDADLPVEWIDQNSDEFKRYIDFKKLASTMKNKNINSSADKLLGKLSITSEDFESFLNKGAKKLDRSLSVFDDRLEV